MLFRANIPVALLNDENALVEQLYIFLQEFVKTRMRYESPQTIEDCVQDTIMQLVKRARDLKRPIDPNFNAEQFFYNRANSYISMWLRRLINNRKQFKKYKGELEHIAKIEVHDRPLYVDFDILNDVIKKLPLSYEASLVVKTLTLNKLVELGYSADVPELAELESYTDTPLDVISYNVVDTYLLEDTNTE